MHVMCYHTNQYHALILHGNALCVFPSWQKRNRFQKQIQKTKSRAAAAAAEAAAVEGVATAAAAVEAVLEGVAPDWRPPVG
jgi:hypothetical protein